MIGRAGSLAALRMGAWLAAGFTVTHAPVTAAQTLVSFPTADGGVVYAYEYGSGEHGVVLAHGGRFTKESWALQAAELAEAGFVVLAIDFRGRGLSRGGRPGSDGRTAGAHLDVLAAVRYLHGRGATRVSVVGASFGGEAAALAAAVARPGEIDRVVLLAHSAIDHPERIGGRKLFVVARGDTTGSGTLRLGWIRDQYERAPGPKRLLVLEGAAHAQHIFETEQGPRVMREIVGFLIEP